MTNSTAVTINEILDATTTDGEGSLLEITTDHHGTVTAVALLGEYGERFDVSLDEIEIVSLSDASRFLSDEAGLLWTGRAVRR